MLNKSAINLKSIKQEYSQEMVMEKFEVSDKLSVYYHYKHSVRVGNVARVSRRWTMTKLCTKSYDGTFQFKLDCDMASVI